MGSMLATILSLSRSSQVSKGVPETADISNRRLLPQATAQHPRRSTTQ